MLNSYRSKEDRFARGMLPADKEHRLRSTSERDIAQILGNFTVRQVFPYLMRALALPLCTAVHWEFLATFFLDFMVLLLFTNGYVCRSLLVYLKFEKVMVEPGVFVA